MNPGILGIRIAMYIMLSLMVGAMYWDLGDQFDHSSIISRTSLLFYVDAFLVFMSIAVLPAFVEERAIVEKEINNKLYHPYIYQISLWVTSWFGVLIIALISSIIVVFMAGLNNFGIFFLDLFLSLLIAEGVVQLCSILVPHYIIGMALVAGLYGMFMLCEGFLVVKEDIPPWFIWGYYLAFHTYTFRIFMHNEFDSISTFTQS
jgi:ABC-type multidrug transport system permease subunit